MTLEGLGPAAWVPLEGLGDPGSLGLGLRPGSGYRGRRPGGPGGARRAGRGQEGQEGPGGARRGQEGPGGAWRARRCLEGPGGPGGPAEGLKCLSLKDLEGAKRFYQKSVDTGVGLGQDVGSGEGAAAGMEQGPTLTGRSTIAQEGQL